MKYFTILFLSVFTFFGFSCKNHKCTTGEKEFYGKVKTIREKMYEAEIVNGEIKTGKVIGSFYDNYQTVYDNKGQKTQQDLYYFNDNLCYRYLFIYTKNGLLKEKQILDSDGKSLYKYIYKYDENGNETEQNIVYHDGSLMNKTKAQYSKDLLMMKTFFDDKGNITTSNEYYYNQDNKLIRFIIYEGSKKLISSRYEYTYDKKGNRLSEELYYSNDSLGHRCTYTYDSRGNILEEMQYNQSGMLFSKIVYRYNSEGKIIETSHYNENNTLSSQYIYKYNDKGMLVEMQKTGENLNYKTSYVYLDQDRHNNWVKRIEYLDDKPVRITVRTFEYYK